MGAQRAWEDCKLELLERLGKDVEAEKAFEIIKQYLERIQQEVMAKQKEPILRQQVGLLFTNVKHAAEMLLTLGEPKIWTNTLTDKKAKPSLSQFIFIIIGFSTFIFLGILEYQHSQWLNVGLLSGGALALLLSQILRSIKLCKGEKEKNIQYKVSLPVDSHQVIAVINKLMVRIDKSIEDLAFLNSQALKELDGQNSGIEMQLLEMMAPILEAQQMNNGEMALKASEEVNKYLKYKGIELVEYGPQVTQYFDTLPGKKEEKTIVPALLQKDKLLRRGLAVICNTSSKEEPVK